MTGRFRLGRPRRSPSRFIINAGRSRRPYVTERVIGGRSSRIGLGRTGRIFDHPDLLEEIRQHIDCFSECSAHVAPSRAEIVLIIDERSICALPPGSKLFKREIYEQLAAWSWCGAPFDVWLAEDVSEATMRDVKLAYVFAPAPTEKLRADLRRILCQGNRSVWWAPYCGWLKFLHWMWRISQYRRALPQL